MAWNWDEFWEGTKKIPMGIWEPTRKYLVPGWAGGGHTEKEKEKILDDYEQIKDKTWGDTFKDILGVDFSGAPMLIIAVIMLVYLALKD